MFRNGHESDQDGWNQTGTPYAREVETQLSTHDYESIHLSTMANNPMMTRVSDLERGGRYIDVTNKELSYNYEELIPPTQTTQQTSALTTFGHGYDIPKPQVQATQMPSLSDNQDGAQGYETPKCVVNVSTSKSKVGFSGKPVRSESKTRAVAGATRVTYNLPQPTTKSSKSCDSIVALSAPPSRKVSDNSTKDKFSSQNVSAHRSLDQLQQLASEDMPDYENLKRAGVTSDQASSKDENPITKQAKPQVKMQLKKPALPSRLFKPTPEMAQILDAKGQAQKRGVQPLTPSGVERKAIQAHATTSKRSQTWTHDNNNLRCKLPKVTNYTQIDVNKMNPKSNYEQV